MSDTPAANGYAPNPMTALRHHDIIFWVTLLVPLACVAVIYPVAVLHDRWYLGEIHLHASLALPLLASYLARRWLRARVRRDAAPPSCVICGPPPLWALAMPFLLAAVSVLLMLPAAATGQFFKFAGLLALGAWLPVLVVVRVGFLAWWLTRCRSHLANVGLLSVVRRTNHLPHFALSTRNGPRYVEIASMDDKLVDLRLEKDGYQETWRVLVPDEDIARAVAEVGVVRKWE